MEEQNMQDTSEKIEQKNLLPFERKSLSILVRKPDANISSKYGKYPEQRTVEELVHYGIININKPRGPTSH